MAENRTVYVLLDPVDGLPFYVGMAKDPKKRLRRHLEEAQAGRGGAKNEALRHFRALRLRPELQILEQTDDPTAEGRWIRRYLEQGANLLNETRDGQGGRSRL